MLIALALCLGTWVGRLRARPPRPPSGSLAANQQVAPAGIRTAPANASGPAVSRATAAPAGACSQSAGRYRAGSAERRSARNASGRCLCFQEGSRRSHLARDGGGRSQSPDHQPGQERFHGLRRRQAAEDHLVPQRGHSGRDGHRDRQFRLHAREASRGECRSHQPGAIQQSSGPGLRGQLQRGVFPRPGLHRQSSQAEGRAGAN